MQAAARGLLLLLLCYPGSRAFPASLMDQEMESDDTRHILGSSVVTSVSVVMDLGNGSKKIYADSTGRPVPKPADATNLASPPSLMSPDRYEFYTFNDEGDLVKRLMTLEEIQSLIAGESVEIGSDLPGYEPEQEQTDEKMPAFFFLPRPIEQSHDWSPPAVDNVVAKVQNILSQMRNSTIDASMNEPSWAILPSSAKPSPTPDYPKITEMIPVSTQTIKDLIKLTTEKMPIEPIKPTTEKVPTTTMKISTQQKIPPPFPISNYVEYEIQKVTKKPVTTSALPPTIYIPIKMKPSTIEPLLNELNENELFDFSTFIPILQEHLPTESSSNKVDPSTTQKTTIKTEAPTTVKITTERSTTTERPTSTIKTERPTSVKVTQSPSTTVKLPVTFISLTTQKPKSTTQRVATTQRIPTFSSTRLPPSGITTEIPPPVKFTKTTTANGLTTLVFSTDVPKTTKRPTTFAQRTTIRPASTTQKITAPSTVIKTTVPPATSTQKMPSTILKTTQPPTIVTQKTTIKYSPPSTTRAPVTTQDPKTTNKPTSDKFATSLPVKPTVDQLSTKIPIPDLQDQVNKVITTLKAPIPTSKPSLSTIIMATQKIKPVTESIIIESTVKTPPAADFIPESIPEDEMLIAELTTKISAQKPSIATAKPVSTTMASKPQTTITNLKPFTQVSISNILNTTQNPQNIYSAKLPSLSKPQNSTQVSNDFVIPNVTPLNTRPIKNPVVTVKGNASKPIVKPTATTQKPPSSGFFIVPTTKKPQTTTQKIMTSGHPEKISTFIPKVTPTTVKNRQNATSTTSTKKPLPSVTQSVTTRKPVSPSTITQKPATKITPKPSQISSTPFVTERPAAKITTKTPQTTVNNKVTSVTEKTSVTTSSKPTTNNKFTQNVSQKTTAKPLVSIPITTEKTVTKFVANLTQKDPIKLTTVGVKMPQKNTESTSSKSPSSTTVSTPTTRTTLKPIQKVSTLKPVPTTLAPQIIFQSDNLLDRNTVLLAESLVNNPQLITAYGNDKTNDSEEAMTSKTSDIDLTSEYSTLLELVTENAKPSTQYVPVNLEHPGEEKRPQKPSKPSELLALLSEITDFGNDDESQETTDSPSATTYFEIPFLSALSGDSEETTNTASASTEYTVNADLFKIPWESSEESTEIHNSNKKPVKPQHSTVFTVKPQVLKPYKPEVAKPDTEFIMPVESNPSSFESVPVEQIPTNNIQHRPIFKPDDSYYAKIPVTDSSKPINLDEIQTDIDAHQAAFLELHKEVMNKLTTMYSTSTQPSPSSNKFSATEKIPESSSIYYSSAKPSSTSSKPVSSEVQSGSNESFEKLTTLEPGNKVTFSTTTRQQPVTKPPYLDSDESNESNESFESSSSEITSSEENYTDKIDLIPLTTTHQNNKEMEVITEIIPDLEVSWQEPQEVIWTAKPGEKPYSPISEVILPVTAKPVKTSPKPSSTTLSVKVKPSTGIVANNIVRSTESPSNNEVKLVTKADFAKTESVPAEFTISTEGSTPSWVTKLSSSESTTQKVTASSLITKKPTITTTTKLPHSPMMTKLTTLSSQKVTNSPTINRTPTTVKPVTQTMKITTLTAKTTPAPKPSTSIKTTATMPPSSLFTVSSASASTSSEDMQLVSSSQPMPQKLPTSPSRLSETSSTVFDRVTTITKSPMETTERARIPDKPHMVAEDMELISSSNAEEDEIVPTPEETSKPSLQQNYFGPDVPLEHAPPNNLGLEATTVALDEDIRRYIDLNNDVAIRMFKHVTSEHDKRRSIALSPFGATSVIAMVFLGARGTTSAQMNDFLPFDDMVTFNPHLVMRNITDSVIMSPDLNAAAIVRQLYSTQTNAKLQDFYKARAGAFYDGLVQEVDFEDVSEIVRQHTNELVRAQTSDIVPEFLSKTATLRLRAPLSALSANVFQMECKLATSQSRVPDLQFNTDRPGVQEMLLSSIWTGQFLVGYDAGLDATAVEIPHSASIGGALTSTVFVMPGKPNSRGGTPLLARLEARLISRRAWSGLLRNLMRSKGLLEVQVPRFEHRSVLNLTVPLRRMGLKDLFNSETADLRGINGIKDLYLTDLMQVNAFSACSDASAEGHVETYPTSRRTGRVGGRQDEDDEDWRSSKFNHLPLSLRPRQARIPVSSEVPRLRLDRPFLYVVRHNPTGMILHIGRFNPRFNS